VIEEFMVSGIRCNSCLLLIKMNIDDLQGIKEVIPGKGKNSVKVNFDEKKVSIGEIIKKIETENYKVVSHAKAK